MSGFNEMLDARQAARQRAEECDNTIAAWFEVARVHRNDVPQIDATDEPRALTSTFEITVSVEWLAFMFDFLAQYDGPRGGAS